MNEMALPAERLHRSPQMWLIFATILQGIGIFAGIGLVLMSAFLFDAPGSEKNRALIMLALSFVAFPVACFLAIPFEWVAYVKKSFRGAVWFSLLPLLPVISAIIGIVWLQVAYGGNFGK
ncbi:MAG: hypothetical protein QOK37_1281 [Thermoanaerobaculia bacterium]|jgi:xanthine/uracil/vitamin C permease (AzgA family)|nr:hypothetical protein [Thermoanaerobaculia bacterium]